MTPNIFISSTIADLHYLRDALREAVEDLAYRPVMSDYGEIGYIAAMTAAESCYRTVRQCQLVVLLIGRRYGDPDKEGLSVTHREFLAAQEWRIPIITFVESDVLSFKKVFDTDPAADLWTKFQGMDHPAATFGLVDLVHASPQFNGMLPFTNAGDAKKALKKQIADFVGERLSDLVLPVRSEVQNVLAEVKNLRSEMEKAGTAKSSPESAKFLAAFRFLLNDNAASFKKFLEHLFGDIDPAIPHLFTCSNVTSLIETSGRKLVIEPKQDAMHQAFAKVSEIGLEYAYHGGEGFYFITKEQQVVMSPSILVAFDRLLVVLKSRCK